MKQKSVKCLGLVVFMLTTIQAWPPVKSPATKNVATINSGHKTLYKIVPAAQMSLTTAYASHPFIKLGASLALLGSLCYLGYINPKNPNIITTR